MPTVKINHEEIFYAQHGEPHGLPIVFIHGAGGTHQRWLPVASALHGCACYALDLPGHGQSSGAGRNHMGPYADVVVNFIEALAIPSAVIAGHSMGGGVALWLALHQPSRVRGLVLASTGAKLRVHPDILQAAKEGRPVSAAAILGGAPPPQPQPTIPPAQAAVTYGDWQASDTFNVMDRLSEIACPTFVIVGDQDVMTPPKYALFMAQNIKGALMVTIADAGHSVISEKPDEVTRAVQAFVNSLPRA